MVVLEANCEDNPFKHLMKGPLQLSFSQSHPDTRPCHECQCLTKYTLCYLYHI